MCRWLHERTLGKQSGFGNNKTEDFQMGQASQKASCAHPFPEISIQRFWAKVDQSSPEGCWPWMGGLRGSPGRLYGKITVRRRALSAHRFSFELHYGEIPEGEGAHGVCVCHRCDNPLCVNPAHLFLGTHLQNMQDKVRKGRDTWANKTHCRNGHERNELNTYTSKQGLKACRVCHRLREQSRRKANITMERKAC